MPRALKRGWVTNFDVIVFTSLHDTEKLINKETSNNRSWFLVVVVAVVVVVVGGGGGVVGVAGVAGAGALWQPLDVMIAHPCCFVSKLQDLRLPRNSPESRMHERFA